MTDGYVLGPRTLDALRALLRRPELHQTVLAGAASQAAPWFFLECWRGLIVAQGPAQEADYTDPRYWIKRAKATCTGGPAAPITLAALDAEDPAYLHITASNLAELLTASHSLPAGTGVQVFALSDTQTPPVKHYYFCQHAATFWAKITGSASYDTPAKNRWKYGFVEQTKATAGYGGWTNLTGGRTGTTSAGYAMNMVEDMNDGAGVEGIGVDVANLTKEGAYTFTIQPCPANVIVLMREIIVMVEGAPVVERWFCYENGVDGTCD